jgi:hypothetical protein
LEGHGTAHKLDEVFRDGQPEPGTAVPPGSGSIPLRKFLKNLGLGVFGYANTGIFNRDRDQAFRSALLQALQVDADVSRIGKLKRIADEIE